MNYTNLLSPLIINGMRLKNRVCMPAISLVYCPDGYINERITQFYVARAKGGTALLTLGGCAIDEIGYSFDMVKISDDKYIEGLYEFTSKIHKAGAKIGIQLFQNGRYGRVSVTGNPVLGPSPVYSKYSKETPREMTIEEIKDTVLNFASAAVRAKRAGFDMVEISASAGYLICQFLSPLTNLRTDEYGGSWENRCRFAKEVIEETRKAVGLNYPIFMRISGNDFVEGSNSNVEAVKFAKLIEEWGVDAINVTGGWHESSVPQITGHLPTNGYAYLTAPIKRVVSIPVIASNRMVDMKLAEELLAIKMADGINMARPLICDPELPNKLKEGKDYLIRRCIACEQKCMDNTFKGKPLSCALNPFAGEEYTYEFMKTTSPKKVLVVGGGVAGMQAAVTAKESGHIVTLWEKADKLGGQLHYAKVASGKQDFIYFVEYLENSMNDLGVKVVLNKEANSHVILSENFDVVIVATGAKPRKLNLPNEGFEGIYVQANDILDNRVIAGKDVVVIGGGAVGCEVAVYLAKKAAITAEEARFLMFFNAEKDERIHELLKKSNRNVTILEVLPKIGKDIGPGTRWIVMKEIKEYGIKKYTEIKTLALTKIGVKIASLDGGEIEVPADTVVYSVGSNSVNCLAKDLENKAKKVFTIGDACSPRKIPDAIEEAIETAMKI